MKKTFCRQYLKKALPLLLLYALVLAFAALVLNLYGCRLEAWGDLIRYTLPFLLAWLVGDFLHERQKTAEIRRWDGQRALKAASPSELALIKRAQLLAADKQKSEQVWNLKAQEEVEQMELLAHEIKNSLTEISGLASQGSQVQSRDLEQPLRQADYQLDLLLGGQRLAADQNDFDFAWCKLTSLVSELLAQNMAVFLEKGVIPEVDLAEVQVLTDRKWLRFIVQQLLSNALKYSTGDQIRIYFKDQALTIYDEGPRIAASDQPRLFEKGFTGQNGHHNAQSTGMGLYFVKEAADKLGLGVAVTSEAKGVAAQVIFPVDQVKGA